MANWRVTLNRPHVALWARGGVWWLTLIVMALIFGPRARFDEVLFATIFLPLAVLVPYAAGTLILAWAKALLLPRLRRRRSWQRGGIDMSSERGVSRE
jgi:hypothetical protein